MLTDVSCLRKIWIREAKLVLKQHRVHVVVRKGLVQWDLSLWVLDRPEDRQDYSHSRRHAWSSRGLSQAWGVIDDLAYQEVPICNNWTYEMTSCNDYDWTIKPNLHYEFWLSIENLRVLRNGVYPRTDKWLQSPSYTAVRTSRTEWIRLKSIRLVSTGVQASRDVAGLP